LSFPQAAGRLSLASSGFESGKRTLIAEAV